MYIEMGFMTSELKARELRTRNGQEERVPRWVSISSKQGQRLVVCNCGNMLMPLPRLFTQIGNSIRRMRILSVPTFRSNIRHERDILKSLLNDT